MELNMKQTLILWLVGISLCSLFLFSPKKYLCQGPYGKVWASDTPGSDSQAVLRWDVIIPGSVTALIAGGLLIFTLKDKKK